MADKALINDRMARIRENLQHLNSLRQMPEEEFCSNFVNFSSAERTLQVAIEACLDIGNHIISEEGFARPREYKDIFLTLGEKNIIPQEFANKLINMARFRNRLVHLYWEVTPQEVYKILLNNLEDLEKYILEITKYIERT